MVSASDGTRGVSRRRPGCVPGSGDVRLAQGDVAGAMESYQQALTGGTRGDTISQRAQEKLNALGKAEP